MVWVNLSEIKLVKPYVFRVNRRSIQGSPVPYQNTEEDRGGFETEKVEPLFVSNGEDIPSLVKLDQGKRRYLGALAFEKFCSDRALIPLAWRKYTRLGFCGSYLVLVERGQPDDDAFLVLHRTRDGWRKGFQTRSSSEWNETAILTVAL